MITSAILPLVIPCSAVAAKRQAQEAEYLDRMLNDPVCVSAPAEIHRSEDSIDEDFTALKIQDDSFLEEGLEIPSTTPVTIHFKHKPELVVENGRYSIPKWNVSWNFPLGGSYNSIGVEMQRQFKRCYREARNQALKGESAGIWINILHDIDYPDYCEQTRPPLYTVGQKIRSIGALTVIRMIGGEEEQVDGEIARALDFVRDGEQFTVLFKRMHGKITTFEDVELLENLDCSKIEQYKQFA